MRSSIERFGPISDDILASIVIVNYKSGVWLSKCLESIKAQTVFDQLETVIVDNESTEESSDGIRCLLSGLPSACLVRHSENLGFCEGNNSGAQIAAGKYLFFLNPDAWLEPDCIERLVTETEKNGAAASTPWVLNYDDNTHQDLGFFGFDIFGLVSPSSPRRETAEIFSASGCACLMNAAAFKLAGMFDNEFFMYVEEVDVSWRIRIAGGKIIGVPAARAHHRGAVNVNPAGGKEVVEFRTSDKKRFYANRNHLLCLLKNCQHFLLLMVFPSLVLLFIEGLVGVILSRRWSFFKHTCLDVLAGCWRLRGHVLAERRYIRAHRKHGDFWMLKFFTFRLNRWGEFKHMLRLGLPVFDPS